MVVERRRIGKKFAKYWDVLLSFPISDSKRHIQFCVFKFQVVFCVFFGDFSSRGSRLMQHTCVYYTAPQREREIEREEGEEAELIHF